MTVKRVKAAGLVLDFTLYPRREIDDMNVRSIVLALEAGVTPPAVIVDRASRKVVDGFHRVTAYLRHFGAEAEIEVDWRDYPSQQDMLLDAIRYNVGHGHRLRPYDQARCLVLADDLGIERERLAQALGMTHERLGSLEHRKIALASNGHRIAIKATMRHLASHELTAEQQAAIPKAGGLSPLYYVNQVILLFEGDLLDASNAALVEQLRVLRRFLENCPLLRAEVQSAITAS